METNDTKHIHYHHCYVSPTLFREKNPITNAKFIDDLTEFLTEALCHHQNIILAGDFSIHINNTG